MGKVPIMSTDDERFMAFEGLVQWCWAIVRQAERITIEKQRFSSMGFLSHEERRKLILESQIEYHYFAIAAYKVIEHRDWTLRLGLLASDIFAPLDKFSRDAIRDLRNMREHVVDYFEGKGRDKGRWMIETPEYSSDASAVNGTLIGGRLDWIVFNDAVRTLLSSLMRMPPFYPPRP
jgi:hypothetical protein